MVCAARKIDCSVSDVVGHRLQPHEGFLHLAEVVLGFGAEGGQERVAG